MITGAFDQTTAAAFRLAPAFGNTSDRIEFASRVPSPAPVICPRQAELQPGAGLADRRRHRPLAGGDLRRHQRREVRPDIERQLHAGLASIVQTSRSRSRTGSPCTTKASPSITIRSPGRGLRHLGDAEVEPRRLRPEPPAAELGDRVGPPRDDANRGPARRRRLIGCGAGDVRVRIRRRALRRRPTSLRILRLGRSSRRRRSSIPPRTSSEGAGTALAERARSARGHAERQRSLNPGRQGGRSTRQKAPLSRTRPTISSAPEPTASTATPTSVLPEATLVTRFAVLSQ